MHLSPSPTLRNLSALLLGAAAISLLPHASGVDYSWSLTNGEGNFVDISNWDVGATSPAAGDKVTINQPDSTVKINNGDTIEYGELDFAAGFMNISGGTITTTGKQHIGSSSGAGYTDYELIVSGGAKFSTTGERLSFGASGGTTDVLITGAGTEVSSEKWLIFGASSSTVNVTLSDGATLKKTGGNEKIILADGANNTAILIVDNATVTSAAEVDIGWSGGQGTLLLSGNSTFTTAEGKTIFIGRSGGTGAVTLSGTSNLTAGKEIWVGNDSGSNGTLNIYGEASATGTTGNFHVGRNGATGTINVGSAIANDSDGKGKLFAKADMMLSEHDNGKAFLNVNSHGAVDVTGKLTVANKGEGTVTLTDNGSLSVGTEIYIGNNSGAVGRMTISDNASVTKKGSSGFITVARNNSTAFLTVEDNGQLISEGSFRIAEGSNANGTVLFKDNASAQVAGTVGVGHQGTGSLTMQNAAQLTANGTLSVGTSSGKGTLTLSGTEGTKITSNGTGTGTIGGGSNAQATVSLSGTAEIAAGNMKWTVGDFGGTGNGGSASVTLADSSKLTLRALTVGHIGGTSASTNITVQDNAILTVNDFITLGRDDNPEHGGQASHINLNGGVLATKYIQAGGGTTASTNNILADGGTIRALESTNSFFRIATKTTTVEGQEPVVTNLSDTATYVVINAGGLTFDTQGFKVGVDTIFDGTGTLTKVGSGTLEFNGSFAGSTIVAAGTLGGSGALGNITVQSGASLAPGNSVGTLTAENVTLETGATLVLEYDAGSLDQINVTNLTFENDSNLYIAVLDGTGMDVGDILIFSNITVDLSGVNISGTDGYAFAYQGGNLVVTAVPEPSTYALLGAAGLLGLVALRRRRKQ